MTSPSRPGQGTPRPFLIILATLLVGCAPTTQLSQPSDPEPVASSPPAGETRLTVSPETGAQPAPVDEHEADGFEDVWDRIRAGMTLPHGGNPRIERELAWFAGRQEYLDRVAQRARPYIHHVVEEIDRRGLPMELALLPVVESAYQPFAYSPSRASGLWQFIPSTGRNYGLKQNWWYDGRRDVVASTEAALDHLEMLHGMFDGDWLLAIAAYNCGEGNVKKALKRNRAAGKPLDFWNLRLPRETLHYVPRLLAVSTVVAEPGRFGLALPSIPDEPYFTTVPLDGQIDLALAAELADVAVDEVYLLNPGFNRWATDPDGPHRLVLPVASAPGFESAVAALPSDARVKWVRHRIREGEHLGGIARRYNTTVAVLKEANGLQNSFIRAGRSLMVPVASRSLDTYTLSAKARAPKPKAPPAGATRVTHVVSRGDTLWDISRAYGVSMRSLAGWNGIGRGTYLRPGQELVVWRTGEPVKATPAPDRVLPASVTAQTRRQVRYTVRRGDSLWKIARRFGVSVGELRQWNDLAPGAYLQPGDRINVHVDVTRQTQST